MELRAWGQGTTARYRGGVSVVELRAAVALLGRFPALSGVDLTIHAGETVLLRGPNGAGKTTLLHLCAGLLRPESGSVQVLDHDLTDSAGRRSVRRRVALLGHTTGLYEDLTVGENLRFWARAAGLSTVDADRRLDDARKRLEVPDRLVDQPVHTLSAGQRRRTSLAALLARRPDLWLLDEPHAGLDQSGRDLVDGLIGDAVAAGGTVVVSSHELDRVAALSPRMVTLAGGAVVDGSGADVPPPVKEPSTEQENSR